ncbi:unnamed protein product [Menidia menidia]|uniref:(Atlantic silverside) hypothetical protein n=1 Tax=Menidia menidia TaxID=238744 RepID=A0A8S4AVS9_9TELE|nr:unnamed protein product [Menidia menidia]
MRLVGTRALGGGGGVLLYSQVGVSSHYHKTQPVLQIKAAGSGLCVPLSRQAEEELTGLQEPAAALSPAVFPPLPPPLHHHQQPPQLPSLRLPACLRLLSHSCLNPFPREEEVVMMEEEEDEEDGEEDEEEEEEAPGSAAVQSSAGRYCCEPGKV